MLYLSKYQILRLQTHRNIFHVKSEWQEKLPNFHTVCVVFSNLQSWWKCLFGEEILEEQSFSVHSISFLPLFTYYYTNNRQFTSTKQKYWLFCKDVLHYLNKNQLFVYNSRWVKIKTNVWLPAMIKSIMLVWPVRNFQIVKLLWNVKNFVLLLWN